MTLKIHFILLFLGFVILIPFFLEESYGHGITSEILEAKTLDDRGVSLNLYSSTSPTEKDHREITFDLRNSETDDFINQVTYSIQVSKNSKSIFEDTYLADEGLLILDMDMISNTISRIESRDPELEDSFKLKSAKIQNIPRLLSTNVPGGLYDFKIEIQSLDNYSNKLSNPIIFESGLSFPSSKFFEVDDPNFGKQKIGLIGYYEEAYDLNYNSQERSISFSMPYSWPEHEQEELFFVHNEILIPRGMGDLRYENFSGYINGIDQTESVFNVDFALDEYLQVHLVTNLKQFNELAEKLVDKNGNKPTVLEYLFVPTDPDDPLSSLTNGGRYRINLEWEPKEIISGQKTTFFIEILDIYSRDKPIPSEYHFTILYGDEEIFHKSGLKTDPISKKDEIEFLMPEEISGPITLRFENIGSGIFSNLDFPVVANRVDSTFQIPDWVKNNARWWASDNISESEFLQAIEYLIENKIMTISIAENENLPSITTTYSLPSSRSTEYVEIRGSFTEKHEGALTLTIVKPDKSEEKLTTISRDGFFMTPMALTSESLQGNYQVFAEIKGKQILVSTFNVKGADSGKVPTWIKNNANWWAQGLITDDDFIKGIQYLVEQGIIRV